MEGQADPSHFLPSLSFFFRKEQSLSKVSWLGKGEVRLPQEIRWLTDVISPDAVGNMPFLSDIEVSRAPSASLCLHCKGGRMLCGKISCPLIARAQALARLGESIDSEHVEGSSPPSVFVGRIGYPKVYLGPMIPPFHGDTEILDVPERWVGKSIQDIIDYRFSLIRGKSRCNVYDAGQGGPLLDTLQELAMGTRPADSEASFDGKPRKILTLSEETQPFGPSALLRSFKTSSVSVDQRIEDAYYDRDLKAADAVCELYEDGVLVSQIQRAFSVGIFGVGARRKLVPTRWSITAVDSTLSLRFIDEIKQYDTIDGYRVYMFRNLDNIFVAVLMPENWKFEWIEAWFPGTTWNPSENSGSAVLMGDSEDYWGRSTYASVGGCYYSCRLAVSEVLRRERRQASALVLREIHPGYILPVGVWNVRESVRAALRTTPRTFDNFNSSLQFAMSQLTIPLKKWMASSTLLKQALFQRRITDYK